MHLIVSDIDGTLIDYAGNLPEANRVALAEAVRRGVRLVLATIRKRDSAELIARTLDLPCALVCQGGATIYAEDGARLREVVIPLEIAREIATLSDEQALPLLTTIDETNYFGPGAPPPKLISDAGVYPADNRSIVTRPPTRFIVRGERGVQLLLERFGNAPLRIVRHYNPDGTLYDAAITGADATKESALELLCRTWRIDRAQVLALGDSEADIGMLRAAGVGVAPDNAHPSVKTAADWIAPHAAEAGLAAAVQRFVLEKADR